MGPSPSGLGPFGRKQAAQQGLFHVIWILECFTQSSPWRLDLVFSLALIAACGITAATLSAFQTRISAYVTAIGSPKVARIKISTATEMLDTEWQFKDGGHPRASPISVFPNFRFSAFDWGTPAASWTPAPFRSAAFECFKHSSLQRQIRNYRGFSPTSEFARADMILDFRSPTSGL